MNKDIIYPVKIVTCQYGEFEDAFTVNSREELVSKLRSEQDFVTVTVESVTDLTGRVLQVPDFLLRKKKPWSI